MPMPICCRFCTMDKLPTEQCILIILGPPICEGQSLEDGKNKKTQKQCCRDRTLEEQKEKTGKSAERVHHARLKPAHARLKLRSQGENMGTLLIQP